MPGRALAGVGGLAELGLALLGQLDNPLLGVRDGPVERVERGLHVAEARRGGGQLPGLGRQVARCRVELPHLGLRQVGGVGEPGLAQPGGKVVNAFVGGPEPRPGRFGLVRRGGRLGVRGLLLLAGHPLALELAKVRVVEGAADRARGAVDQGGGELGAHAVDPRLTQPRRLHDQLGRVKLRGAPGPLLTVLVGQGLDQGARVVGGAAVAVGLGPDGGPALARLGGLIALAAALGALPLPRVEVPVRDVDLGGQRGRGGPGLGGGLVLVVRLQGHRAQRLQAAVPRHVLLGRVPQRGGADAGFGVSRGPGLFLGGAGLGERGGGPLGLGQRGGDLGGAGGGGQLTAPFPLRWLRRGPGRRGYAARPAGAAAGPRGVRSRGAGPGPGPGRRGNW